MFFFRFANRYKSFHSEKVEYFFGNVNLLTLKVNLIVRKTYKRILIYENDQQKKYLRKK